MPAAPQTVIGANSAQLPVGEPLDPRTATMNPTPPATVTFWGGATARPGKLLATSAAPAASSSSTHCSGPALAICGQVSSRRPRAATPQASASKLVVGSGTTEGLTTAARPSRTELGRSRQQREVPGTRAPIPSARSRPRSVPAAPPCQGAGAALPPHARSRTRRAYTSGSHQAATARPPDRGPQVAIGGLGL